MRLEVWHPVFADDVYVDPPMEDPVFSDDVEEEEDEEQLLRDCGFYGYDEDEE